MSNPFIRLEIIKFQLIKSMNQKQIIDLSQIQTEIEIKEKDLITHIEKPG